MRAQSLPAAAGWGWIVGGLAIFRRNPPILAMLVVTYWFTVLILSAVPILGTVAASLMIPGLSVGLMQACRSLERGQVPGIQTLFGGLRQNPRTLLALGALYLACTLGILMASSLADDGELMRIMLSGKPVEREVLESGRLVLPAALVMGLLTPLLMAYWFAPILAAWHRLPMGKSLFFSLVACWLNWRAFLAYGLGLALVGVVGPGLVLGLVLLVFPGAAGFLAVVMTLPMVLLLAPIVFASFYVSYRDVFGVSTSV